MSYTKTNKLVTALYMVTDVIDKDEPLRNKLRTLGTGIISDTYLIKQDHTGHIASLMSDKVQETMSFLDIAAAMNIISEMNCNILRKEFFELNESIKESLDTNKIKVFNGQVDLAEFFANPPLLDKEGNEGRFLNSPHPNPLLVKERGKINSKGHTRLGVQKGSTLLKALSRVQVPASPSLGGSGTKPHHTSTNGFDILKKQRRAEITNFITKKGGNVTITDIKNGAGGLLISCGEKTLQRELVSMVKDGVLNKTGEKRWSRYFLK